MTIDFDGIEERARKAEASVQGNWFSDPAIRAGMLCSPEDAAHIAGLDPQTALGMVARIRELEQWKSEAMAVMMGYHDNLEPIAMERGARLVEMLYDEVRRLWRKDIERVAKLESAIRPFADFPIQLATPDSADLINVRDERIGPEMVRCITAGHFRQAASALAGEGGALRQLVERAVRDGVRAGYYLRTEEHLPTDEQIAAIVDHVLGQSPERSSEG